jgi:mRNA interferase RelE/StbE
MTPYVIRYVHLLNPKAVARLPKTDVRAIKRNIEQKLTTHPDLFGKPLRRSLRGYRSLRVNAYRVIYRIQGSEVLIFIIDHRSVVYEVAEIALSH